MSESPASKDYLDSVSARMKSDWNARARENPRFFIASGESETEAEFLASGERDVAIFFHGIEDLLHPGQDVLDIGCGMGRMDRVIAPKVRSLVGVDVSAGMVRLASERLAELDNVRFVEVSGYDLAPIADASISLVFSHIVFQHMPRLAAKSYLHDIPRVLAPGGALVFQVMESVDVEPMDLPDDDTFGMRYYREDHVRAPLEGLGFDVLDVFRVPEGTGGALNHMRFHARLREGGGA